MSWYSTDTLPYLLKSVLSFVQLPYLLFLRMYRNIFLKFKFCHTIMQLKSKSVSFSYFHFEVLIERIQLLEFLRV